MTDDLMPTPRDMAVDLTEALAELAEHLRVGIYPAPLAAVAIRRAIFAEAEVARLKALLAAAEMPRLFERETEGR